MPPRRAPAGNYPPKFRAVVHRYSHLPWDLWDLKQQSQHNTGNSYCQALRILEQPVYRRTGRLSEPRKIEGGPRLGSRAPVSRSVVRPRRDRTMGSSILASLSEAGGNDPYQLVNGPLPPHALDSADRVERDRTLSHASSLPIFKDIPKQRATLFSITYKRRSVPFREYKIKSGSAVPERNARLRCRARLSHWCCRSPARS